MEATTPTTSQRHQKALNFLQTLMENGEFKFEEFDTDGSKTLSKDELTKGFEKIGHPLPEACINDIIEVLDADHDGEIDISELEKLNAVVSEVVALKKKAAGTEWDVALGSVIIRDKHLIVDMEENKGQPAKLIALLMEKHKTCQVMDHHGLSALALSVICGDKVMFHELLRQEGVNPDRRPLGERNFSDFKGIDVNKDDTPRSLAVKRGWIEEGGDLMSIGTKAAEPSRLAGGAGATSQSTQKFTIKETDTKTISTLDLVVLKQLSSADLIAELGDDIDAVDKWGFTCLMQAKVWGKTDLAAALVAAGASETKQTTRDHTINGKSVKAGTKPSDDLK